MRLADDDVDRLLVGRGDEHRVVVAEVEQTDQVLLELGLDAADVVAGRVGHDHLVAAARQRQLVAGAQLGGRLGTADVGQLGDRGLAALLDEQARVDRRGRRRGRASGGELAQALQVLGSDAVERIELDSLGIGVARLGVAAELGQGFAQPVIGVHLVREHLEDLPIELGRLIPAILHRQANGLFGLGALLAQPVLSGECRHSQTTCAPGLRRPSAAPAQHRIPGGGPLSLALTQFRCNLNRKRS